MRTNEILLKQHPPTEAYLELLMGKVLRLSVFKVLGRTSGIAESVVSENPTYLNINPGSPLYDINQDARVQRYITSLDRSLKHNFVLLSEVDMKTKESMVEGLTFALDLTNYKDRDRLVHPPFYRENEKPIIRVGIPLQHLGLRRTKTTGIDERFDSLREVFAAGPAPGLAPRQFTVTHPRVILPIPSEPKWNTIR